MDWVDKAREAGILEQGIREGYISITQLTRREMKAYFNERKKTEGSVGALHDVATKFKLSYNYARKVCYGSV